MMILRAWRLSASLAKALVSLLIFGFCALAASPAAAVTCTNPQGSHFLDISVPDTYAASCYNGSKNINGDSNDAFLKLNLGYVDLPGALSVDTTKGTFTIAQALVAGYDLVLGLKQGDGWAAFVLKDNVFSGTYTTKNGSGAAGFDLSHAELYGLLASVPLPATLPLLAAGLGALGLLGWRKRRTPATT
jgi:hypothetical protein